MFWHDSCIVLYKLFYMMKFSKISVFILLFLSLCAISLAASNIVEAVNDTGREVKVYPNPVLGDEFTIVSNKEIVEVTVLNLLGQAVYSKKYIQLKIVSVELDKNDRGIYLVQIRTADGNVISKRILFK